MHLIYDNVDDSVQFCYDIIGKEVRQDDKLVRQTFLTILSAYTKNPINLAINAPTGEGKSYVINKVADLFPKSDVIYLSAMTDKSLFHRKGTLVIKNENGEYQNTEDKILEIESEIEDKESESLRTNDKNLKQGLQSEVKELQNQKRDLLKNAVKLIDLNHKVLIFGDTPRHSLLEAIMSLLSHDRYEVEYEYVDTFNGIKTKNNILRGFPTVIFTAAIDYSKYNRWDEIQRRFIITNPKMSIEKYKESIHLKGARFGLPEFAYEVTVVPVLNVKQKRLLDSNDPNNFSQNKLVRIEDLTVFPSREYLISKITDILKYSYDANDLTRLQDHEGKETTAEDVVSQYYNKPEEYFVSSSIKDEGEGL